MNFYRIASDIKGFLSNEINRLFVIVIIVSVGFSFALYQIHKENTEIKAAITKCEKKVDFRYFNMTRSLEEIHNVKLDTKDGELKK